MQKLWNDPSKVVEESIDGFVKCYRNYVTYAGNPRALKYLEAPVKGKVGIVSGGGSGHNPAFKGYIGKNMLDAVAIGNIFSPPSVEAFYSAFKAADSGNGVVCLYGNFPADIENAEAAIELAAKEGIVVKSVIANDDVATPEPEKRRGATGEVVLWKIGGAAAALGYNIDEVVSVCTKAIDRTRSIGVGLASCIIPDYGHPNYVIEKGTMEIGVGHHGFQSKDTCKLRTANEVAAIMVDEILRDMPLGSGDKAALMVSGLGNTMLCELNILYSKIHDLFTDKKIDIYHTFLGNYFTSLDMMGVTLTVISLDDELIRLLEVPAYPVSMSHFLYK
jgi:dihydroxyacetone kinase-like protein